MTGWDREIKSISFDERQQNSTRGTPLFQSPSNYILHSRRLYGFFTIVSTSLEPNEEDASDARCRDPFSWNHIHIISTHFSMSSKNQFLPLSTIIFGCVTINTILLPLPNRGLDTLLFPLNYPTLLTISPFLFIYWFGDGLPLICCAFLAKRRTLLESSGKKIIFIFKFFCPLEKYCFVKITTDSRTSFDLTFSQQKSLLIYSDDRQ